MDIFYLDPSSPVTKLFERFIIIRALKDLF